MVKKQTSKTKQILEKNGADVKISAVFLKKFYYFKKDVNIINVLVL